MVSHSSTSSFNTCPFSYKLSKIDNLHKAVVGPESNKLAWGHAMHRGLEAYYSPRTKHTDNDNYVQAFLDAYPDDLDPQDGVWCREGGVKTLEAYDSYYAAIDQQWEVVDVEVADDKAKPTLIIDLVAKHRQTGSVYFFDHKFKVKAPFGANRRYEIDAQISRYTDWVQDHYGDCAGAIINIVVPGFRQRAYKGEPAGWYWKFERVVVQRTPQQLAFWRESQREWERLIYQCQNYGYYPKHLGHNCSYCEFYELCCSGDDEEVKNSLYTTEPIESLFKVMIEDE